MSFPSTNKFFALRYGVLWCASLPYDQQVPSISPIDYQKNAKFLQPYPQIRNFEFNSTKKAAFIQISSDIYVYIGLRKLSFVKEKVKSAHFSSRCENHLFVLNDDDTLMILDISKGDYIPNFEIRKVKNFSFFPKINQSHYIAIILDKGFTYELSYIDSILLEGQTILNNSIIPPIDILKNGVVQKNYILSSPTSSTLQKFEYDIIVGNKDTFIGNENGEIFCISDDIIAGNKDALLDIGTKKKLSIGSIQRFQGFISNDEIFAISEECVKIPSRDGLIDFYSEKAICALASPRIIACEAKTIYMYGEEYFEISESGDNVVENDYRISEELAKYLNDSFFERVNIMQVRGERLQRRQEQMDRKIKKLVFDKSDTNHGQILKLKQDFEELRDRLLDGVAPYDSYLIDSIRRGTEDLKKKIEDSTK